MAWGYLAFAERLHGLVEGLQMRVHRDWTVVQDLTRFSKISKPDMLSRY